MKNAIREYACTAGTVARYVQWRVIRAIDTFWHGVEKSLNFASNYLYYRRTTAMSRREALDMAGKVL